MKFDDFVGEVQNRLEQGSKAEAVRSTRAVLTTIGEYLQEGEAQDLAGSLPMEIDFYVLNAESGQRMDWSEFVERVSAREDGSDEADAAYHAREIVDFLRQALPGGEFQDIRDNFEPGIEEELFELVDQRTGE